MSIVHCQLSIRTLPAQGAAYRRPLWVNCLVNGLVIRVNHAVVAGLIAGLAALGLTLLRACLLIQLLGDCVESLLDFLGSGLDGFYIGALVDFLQMVHSGLDL